MLLSLILVISLSSTTQIKDTDRITRTLTDDQILAPLRYLSSDRLRGRHFQVFNHPFTPLEKHRMDLFGRSDNFPQAQKYLPINNVRH